MAIKGSLKEASLPDVLQLLSMGKKTGCLAVTHRSNFGYIYFDKGRISYASIVNRRDRIGDTLMKHGVITAEQVEAAINQQGRERDKRLGTLLVEMGFITQNQLREYVQVQIEEAVYFLFTWNQGSFNFDADVVPEQQDILVSINPESLLLEGARRVDEWSLVEKKIPSFDLVFEVDRPKVAQSDVALPPEQQAILALVDGRRDLQAIVDESGMVEFDVGKAMYGLATAGFVHRVGKTAAAAPQVSEARIEEHRNLGVAFYKTGMLDEAQREFSRVLALRAGDNAAKFFVALVTLRQGRVEEAATMLQEMTGPGARPAVYHNLAFALERLGRLDEAKAALQDALTKGGKDDARVQTAVGVIALRTGDPSAADAALQVARPLFGKRPPTAVWYHYAALAAALQGDHERAAKVLEEGVQHHPHSAPLLNNLAAVHERRNQVELAMATLEKGIGEDPGLAQLHKNVGDLHYRGGRYDDALESYQRAVKANSELGEDVWLKLGNIRFRRHEREDAARCWEKALELDPTNAIVRTNLDAVRERA